MRDIFAAFMLFFLEGRYQIWLHVGAGLMFLNLAVAVTCADR